MWIMSVKNENRKLVRSLPKMVLLNSEGNILTAYKKNDKFLIMDEYYEIFNSLDSDDLYKFTRGGLDLTNSKDEVFNYPSFSSDMKPNLKQLDEFIGFDETGFTI